MKSGRKRELLPAVTELRWWPEMPIGDNVFVKAPPLLPFTCHAYDSKNSSWAWGLYVLDAYERLILAALYCKPTKSKRREKFLIALCKARYNGWAREEEVKDYDS